MTSRVKLANAPTEKEIADLPMKIEVATTCDPERDDSLLWFVREHNKFIIVRCGCLMITVVDLLIPDEKRPHGSNGLPCSALYGVRDLRNNWKYRLRQWSIGLRPTADCALESLIATELVHGERSRRCNSMLFRV